MALRVIKYDKDSIVDGIKITVACAEGDHIALNSSGDGILADATDATKQSDGVAMRDVTAADITAGGSRAKASLARRCRVNGFTSQNPSTGRRFLAVAGASGSTDTVTRPTATGALIQPVGKAVSATEVDYNIMPSDLVVQAVATSTVAFG